MKTRTLDLAYEWGLNIVEVTQGVNGYPEGLYKAIAGFDYFENAEDFAEKVNGEVKHFTSMTKASKELGISRDMLRRRNKLGDISWKII